MIILTPGSYTRKQIEEMDLGTNGRLPTVGEAIIIRNPPGYGFHDYRVSKEKSIRSDERQPITYVYVIKEI